MARIEQSRNTTEIGENFEREVAAAFTRLGYSVTRNEPIGGHQVDVVARQPIKGASSVVVAIEAKHLTKGKVSKATILNYLAVARDLLAKGSVTHAVVVSRFGLSLQAQANIDADDPRISHATLDELASRTFFDPAHAEQSLFSLSALPGLHRYVESTVLRTHEGPGQLVDVSTTRNLLDSCLRIGNRAAVVLTADFGAGKTTLLRRMKVIQLTRFIAGESDVLPLLFHLSQLKDFATLDGFLERSLRGELGGSPDVDEFWQRLTEGRLLVLLDGFDEIMTQSSMNDRHSFLLEIAPVLFGGSASVLTTRPSYFEGFADLEQTLQQLDRAGGGAAKRDRLAQRMEVERRRALETLRRRRQAPGLAGVQKSEVLTCSLQAFTAAQIDTYLANLADDLSAVGVLPQDVRRFLAETYDLSDLASRPILLEMICDLVLEEQIDIHDSRDISSSDLYDLYVDYKLQDDLTRALHRSRLSVIVRRDFAEACAIEMLRQGTLSLSLHDAVEVAGRLREIGPAKAARDGTMTDLRTCSFLTISGDDSLAFVHKSFYEYFLACRLYRAVLAADGEQLAEYVPAETCYFLGSMWRGGGEAARASLDAVRKLIGRRDWGRDLADRQISILWRNVCSALVHAGEPIVGLKTPTLDIDLGVGPTAVRLVDCELGQTVLRGTDLASITVEDSHVGTLKIERPSSTNPALAAIGSHLGLPRSEWESVKLERSFAWVVAGSPLTSISARRSRLAVACTDTKRLTISADRSTLMASPPTGDGGHLSLTLADSSLTLFGAGSERLGVRGRGTRSAVVAGIDLRLDLPSGDPGRLLRDQRDGVLERAVEQVAADESLGDLVEVNSSRVYWRESEGAESRTARRESFSRLWLENLTEESFRSLEVALNLPPVK